jgi:hypothetical protein
MESELTPPVGPTLVLGVRLNSGLRVPFLGMSGPKGVGPTGSATSELVGWM